MRRYIQPVLVLLGLFSGNPIVADENPGVILNTNQGEIYLQLYPQQAPMTVKNFLRLVDKGFYDGLIFHRVEAGFVIQTGGYDATMNIRPDNTTVVNESRNGLTNLKGTVAMARNTDPDSADTQFYINVADNPHLDSSPDQWGYTVFGRVIKGWDVVETIELTDTHRVGDRAAVPERPIVIESIRRITSRN